MVVKVITFIQFMLLIRLTNILVIERFPLVPRQENSLLRGVEKQKMELLALLCFMVNTRDMVMFAQLVGGIESTVRGHESDNALKH